MAVLGIGADAVTCSLTPGSGNIPALKRQHSMRSSKLMGDKAGSAEAAVPLQPVEQASPLSIWPGGWVLYEISTRPWLYSLSKKYKTNISKLSDIPDEEFHYLKERGNVPSRRLVRCDADRYAHSACSCCTGVDMVWMMGMFELGAYGLKHDKTSQNLVNGYRQLLPDYTEAGAFRAHRCTAE